MASPSILQKVKNCFTFQQKLVWINIFGLLVLHSVFLYVLVFRIYKMKLLTFLWGIFLGQVTGVGISLGAHRLWTHRAYKATLPFRVFLMLCFVISGEYSIVQWARDHRLHHKCTDTDADPHNAKRGFFFSHVGWLMMKRHPDVKEVGKTIDLSDLWEDPVIRFHQKYFYPLLIIFFVIMPSAVPMIFWNESLTEAILSVFFFRYCLQLNFAWCVNSFAHFVGSKPYDKSIMATQNKYVSFFTIGEGWHNFHHVFPWDYRIGEFGQGIQSGAAFLEICEKLGFAYDLKSASLDMVSSVMKKTKQKQKEL